MTALAEKSKKLARVVPNAPWALVPLGELAANEPASITDGPFGSKLKSAHYTASGPRVIRLQNIGEMVFVDAKAHISESHFDSLKRHRVFPDDLVIAALGENPPRACMIPDWLGPAIVKADCIRFKCGPRILPKFLLYALHQPELRRHAKGIIHGVGRPRLNLSEIKSLPIPVPPLPEQRRIVAEIEQQFTRLDAGVAALRSTQANLKRYRAAVLKAACEGRLVPTEAELAQKERRKYETGDQLLSRILTDRRKGWTGRGKYTDPTPQNTLDSVDRPPEGWALATVEQLSQKVQFGHTASAVQRSTGVRFLRITDIQDRRVDWESVPSCDISQDDTEALLLLPGDLVFARTGATVGKSYLLKAPFPPSVFASYPNLPEFFMRSSFTLIPLLLLFATAAQARLGETLPELQGRFGEPTAVRKEQVHSPSAGKLLDIGTRYTFRDGEWIIEVVIVEDRSSKEVYSKRGQWTDQQVATVLNANSQGAGWTESGPVPLRKSVREWKRSDGGTAKWMQNVHLTVTHPAFEREKVKKEAKAKAEAARPPRI